MAIMRPMSELRDQMERLLHDMEEFRMPSFSEFRPFKEHSGRAWLPSVDLYESDGNYELKMELPGLKPDDLDVQVLEDEVVIKGETREEKAEEKKDIYRRECHYGSIYRRVPLPGSVKAENVTAELKHGILSLKMPKAIEEKGKHIRVQAK